VSSPLDNKQFVKPIVLTSQTVRRNALERRFNIPRASHKSNLTPGFFRSFSSHRPIWFWTDRNKFSHFGQTVWK